MQRFCCIPFNESPDVNVKMNCVSTCCASDLKSKENIDYNDDVKPETSYKKHSCCCKKKRSKSQANKKGKVEFDEMKNE